MHKKHEFHGGDIRLGIVQAHDLCLGDSEEFVTGKSGTFVKVLIGGTDEIFVTEIIKDQFTDPCWNAVCEMNLDKTEDVLLLVVYRRASIGKITPLGSLTLLLAEFPEHAGEIDRWFDIEPDTHNPTAVGKLRLTIHLEKSKKVVEQHPSRNATLLSEEQSQTIEKERLHQVQEEHRKNQEFWEEFRGKQERQKTTGTEAVLDQRDELQEQQRKEREENERKYRRKREKQRQRNELQFNSEEGKRKKDLDVLLGQLLNKEPEVEPEVDDTELEEGRAASSIQKRWRRGTVGTIRFPRQHASQCQPTRRTITGVTGTRLEKESTRLEEEQNAARTIQQIWRRSSMATGSQSSAVVAKRWSTSHRRRESLNRSLSSDMHTSDQSPNAAFDIGYQERVVENFAAIKHAERVAFAECVEEELDKMMQNWFPFVEEGADLQEAELKASLGALTISCGKVYERLESKAPAIAGIDEQLDAVAEALDGLVDQAVNSVFQYLKGATSGHWNPQTFFGSIIQVSSRDQLADPQATQHLQHPAHDELGMIPVGIDPQTRKLHEQSSSSALPKNSASNQSSAMPDFAKPAKPGRSDADLQSAQRAWFRKIQEEQVQQSEKDGLDWLTALAERKDLGNQVLNIDINEFSDDIDIGPQTWEPCSWDANWWHHGSYGDRSWSQWYSQHGYEQPMNWWNSAAASANAKSHAPAPDQHLHQMRENLRRMEEKALEMEIQTKDVRGREKKSLIYSKYIGHGTRFGLEEVAKLKSEFEKDQESEALDVAESFPRSKIFKASSSSGPSQIRHTSDTQSKPIQQTESEENLDLPGRRNSEDIVLASLPQNHLLRRTSLLLENRDDQEDKDEEAQQTKVDGTIDVPLSETQLQLLKRTSLLLGEVPEENQVFPNASKRRSSINFVKKPQMKADLENSPERCEPQKEGPKGACLVQEDQGSTSQEEKVVGMGTDSLNVDAEKLENDIDLQLMEMNLKLAELQLQEIAAVQVQSVFRGHQCRKTCHKTPSQELKAKLNRTQQQRRLQLQRFAKQENDIRELHSLVALGADRTRCPPCDIYMVSTQKLLSALASIFVAVLNSEFRASEILGDVVCALHNVAGLDPQLLELLLFVQTALKVPDLEKTKEPVAVANLSGALR